MDLKAHIRSIPDFPKPGILFYDICTLLAHGPAWVETIRQLKAQITPFNPDVLIAIDSRGFLAAAALANELGIGIVLARKKGKLPGKTIAHSYALEYGEATLELQQDILKPGARAVIIDDLLATGGTAAAALTLARKLGANVVAMSFIIELSFLHGRNKLDVPVTTLLTYDD